MALVDPQPTSMQRHASDAAFPDSGSQRIGDEPRGYGVGTIGRFSTAERRPSARRAGAGMLGRPGTCSHRRGTSKPG